MYFYNRLLFIFLMMAIFPFGISAQESSDSLRVQTSEQAIPVQRSIRKVSLTNLQTPLGSEGESLDEATLVYNTNPEIGKGLYYWNGSVWAQVMADDDGDPETDAIKPPKTKEFLEALAKLLGALAWPGTLLLILFLFRSGFSGAIKRIGGFKVDNTGLSVDFNDEIEAAKEIFSDLKEAATAKSGGSIQPMKTSSPYVQLVSLKGDISNTLDRRAREADVNQGPSGINNRLDQLVGAGQMENTQAEMVRTLIGLIDSAKRDVTQPQVDRIENLYKEINL